MESRFKTVALTARQNRPGLVDTLQKLIALLREQQIDFVVETESAQLANDTNLKTIEHAELGKDQDLVIVIGGDGSLLRAAKAAAAFNTPVLGINRGSLGFLTDINPADIDAAVKAVLAGDYSEESRSLLNMYVHVKGQSVASGLALNDIVLLPGKENARLIEFDVHINKEFVYRQRSDGLIIATPTGSTAYALSGGGPIIKPDLDANVIVPMLPHTLSMRPIVVNANNRIKVTIANDLDTEPQVSCDGEQALAIPPGGHLHIDKSELQLRLLHPKDYDYFHTLRTKLKWGEKLC